MRARALYVILRDKIFLLTLGRETTTWEIAKRILGKPSKEITTSEMGPFYNCKTELMNKGLLVERPRVGRVKPITADTNVFLNSVLKDPKDKPFRFVAQNLAPVFEKYVAKIVDFLMEKGRIGVLEEDSELSDIFYIFMSLSMYLCKPKNLKIFLSDEKLKSLYCDALYISGGSDFPTFGDLRRAKHQGKKLYSALATIFSKKEKRELCFTSYVKTKEAFVDFITILVDIAPSEIFKRAYQLGIRKTFETPKER